MAKSKPPIAKTTPRYEMRISRLTVDKLGVKLYDRVSAVIAELVANSYDADATKVKVSAPMGELLAERHQGLLRDKGYSIEVADNGSGMTPEEVNEFYLVVGAERRQDPRRGNLSKKFQRKVMGRKGVGKLAPLGICQTIEVITAGGAVVDRKGHRGYVTAHFILDRTEMMKDTNESYFPSVGELNGTIQAKPGTKILLTEFDHRLVPKIDDFDRQLSQRFGPRAKNWQIILKDSQKTSSAPDAIREVGELSIDIKPHTKIEFREKLDKKQASFSPPQFSAFDEQGAERSDISPTFELEGNSYSVTGWMGYSEKPYKDDLMAGVRIYCRGKIAAQTNIFNMKAGFTGEHDVRSYLVGSLHADWLDEEDDLIRTDRQDILWSHPLGRAFEEWGQKCVKFIGKLTREPMRRTAWNIFSEQTKIATQIEAEFPGDHQAEIRRKTLEIAESIAKSARPEELEDANHCRTLVNLAILLGPHITLEEKLTEASGDEHTLEVVNSILRVARVAELSSFGRIADDRIKVIRKVEELKDNNDTKDELFRTLIEQTPWLINPQWSPISDNQSLANIRNAFQQYYKSQNSEALGILGASPVKSDRQREGDLKLQLIMTIQDSVVELIDIKRPGHTLENNEMDRIVSYHDSMDSFFADRAEDELLRGFERFHITLVCDKLNLKGAQKVAFSGMQSSGGLTLVSWGAFLKRTRKMHEAFLKEADRQKSDAKKR